MRVWLIASSWRRATLTVQDVEAAIRTRNVEIPAGRIESDRREFSVRSLGELKTPEEFAGWWSPGNGQVVKLQGPRAGRPGCGGRSERISLPGEAVGRPRHRAPVEGRIWSRWPMPCTRPCRRFARELPPGVRITLRSINPLRQALHSRGGGHAIIAAILVVIIIFLFLRNLRATIIPAVAIPTSIIATFAVMYFLGFSINNLTLLALTLAIGIVVDDAIIVLENAFRHQEELHEDPETAATNGTREIAFAVIATTISLVAVFTPLAFLQGSTGRLFNEFGIAVAGSVVISGFVALTMTPMLCAKILRVPPRHGRLYRDVGARLQWSCERLCSNAPLVVAPPGPRCWGRAHDGDRCGSDLSVAQARVRTTGRSGLFLHDGNRA